jgi:hypothetical protein
MTVPSSKPRHWLVSDPFGSNPSRAKDLLLLVEDGGTAVQRLIRQKTLPDRALEAVGCSSQIEGLPRPADCSQRVLKRLEEMVILYDQNRGGFRDSVVERFKANPR